MPDTNPTKAAQDIVGTTSKVFYTETDKTVMFIDAETGGLYPGNSFLSFAAVCWVDGQIRDQKEWLIKHKIYNVTAEGLAVNRIDLVQHHKTAMLPAEAAKDIRKWIDATFHPMARITFGGHNLSFDVENLRPLLDEFYPSYWKGRFSYRMIDTSSLLIFLNHSGLTPPLQGLDQALTFFGVKVGGPRHTALWDAVATADLYTNLRSMAREKLL
jgi:DNA polymerase III epsilon subunit-like protein